MIVPSLHDGVIRNRGTMINDEMRSDSVQKAHQSDKTTNCASLYKGGYGSVLFGAGFVVMFAGMTERAEIRSHKISGYRNTNTM